MLCRNFPNLCQGFQSGEFSTSQIRNLLVRLQGLDENAICYYSYFRILRRIHHKCLLIIMKLNTSSILLVCMSINLSAPHSCNPLPSQQRSCWTLPLALCSNAVWANDKPLPLPCPPSENIIGGEGRESYGNLERLLELSTES
jgi:hypothetical protein